MISDAKPEVIRGSTRRCGKCFLSPTHRLRFFRVDFETPEEEGRKHAPVGLVDLCNFWDQRIVWVGIGEQRANAEQNLRETDIE